MNDKTGKLKSKLIYDKLQKHHLLVSGYSSSKKYGVNSSNVYDFRRRLGFSKIYTFENLQSPYVINNEMSGFSSVYDEIMIDTLVNQVNLNSGNVFLYGFTTNTHFPYKHNLLNPYIKRLSDFDYLNLSNYSTVLTKSLLLRIFSTIDFTLYLISKNNIDLDKVLFVGDHSYPGNKDFSQEQVPAFILLKKK